MIGLMLSLAWTFGASQNIDVQAKARQFLEAFAANPIMAKQFVTDDANIIIGDIGGPYDDYVKAIQSADSWLKTCHVASLKEKPVPSVDEWKDAPPRYRGGKIAIVEGSYSCTRADGLKSDVKASVILRDDRIMELYLGLGAK